jgi:hypothetical protein
VTELFASSAAQDRPLPDPRVEQMLSAHGALRDADQAALRTRRLLDASRSMLTGNMAMGFCLPATLMVWWEVARDGDRSRVLGALVMIGFAAWVLLSLRWLVGLRSSGGVKVVDRIEVNLDEIREHPIRRLVPYCAVMLASGLAWSYLFRVMPYSGIVIVMWTVVAMFSGLFVGRFFLFHFWEDLLFAVSVALAWGLYLLQARQLAPLAIVPPRAVIVGTVCLHHRWRNWARSLPASEAAPASPEGCS